MRTGAAEDLLDVLDVVHAPLVKVRLESVQTQVVLSLFAVEPVGHAVQAVAPAAEY